MANSPSSNSIEMQIDNFLEQFKRSASKAMEGEWPTSSSNLIRSKSRISCFETYESSDEATEAIENVAGTNSQGTNFQHTHANLFQHQSSISSQTSVQTVLHQSTTNNYNINLNSSINSNLNNQTNLQLTPSNTMDDATPLCVADVADLLHPQYAIITGGRCDGSPIIQFPDHNNFQSLTEQDYLKLIRYLTSVPTLQEVDAGFYLIIDRRKDRWASVKAVLLKVSVSFPGNIKGVYVLRPAGFFQKAISEVSSKFFKEEFHFRLVICASIDDLHENIPKSQLTCDLGGTLVYSHHEWIQQRISLEKFSNLTNQISSSLDAFIRVIQDTEFPNSVESTQKLLDEQGAEYENLKEEILSTAKHGEQFLDNFKTGEEGGKEFAERTGNISAIESAGIIYENIHHFDDSRDYRRLLVQLEETERRFDEFWNKHLNKLKQCLELRRFEQDFRELQTNFDSHLKHLSEMTEIGETVFRVNALLRETKTFEKICQQDIERAEEVIATGQQLINSRNSCPKELVQPKCDELSRVCDIVTTKLAKRLETLSKNRDLMERVEKANKWCAKGVELLASQRIEQCSNSNELAEQSLQEIQEFLTSAAEFKSSSPSEKNVFIESTTPETKALVTQVLQRIADVNLMCDKRITCLKKLTLKPPRPIQTVTPEPAVPLQPAGGAPHPFQLRKSIHKKSFDSNRSMRIRTTPGDTNLQFYNGVESRPRSIEGPLDSGVSFNGDTGSSPDSDNSSTNTQNQIDLEARRLKRGHVLAELLETERLYVAEMGSILKGYRDQMASEDLGKLVPPGLQGKEDILFGNLHELYTFHSDIFLKDLENCISTTELVALCFVQRRETFYRLYSYYCQNIPRSEYLRETLIDTHLFLQECQKRLGHKLPLAAYLLKPVQRITKYQLLLKDLLKFSDSGQCGRELQKALDCMLIVLKCVNDSMHQIAITGFPNDLSQQGELLMQDSFQVWTDSKRDLRLRMKTQNRHIFLYQKVLLFCKPESKTGQNKSTYQYKHDVKMSQIGLTESVRGDPKKFEIWLQGRQEVHTIQATSIEIKTKWVSEIKKVLLNQLEELKGEKIKLYGLHKPLKQAASWDMPASTTSIPQRTRSCDVSTESNSSNRNSIISEDMPLVITGISSSSSEHDQQELNAWSSDYSNSEDEFNGTEDSVTPGSRFISLADYCAMGHSEVSMKEGDHIELLKVGCAGWWFVKILGNNLEGWAPAAYLESINKKSTRCSSRNQD